MWLALREGNAVYRLELDKGTIHHVAGTGKKGFTGNGGPAKKATLSGPKGIAVGPRGNIYLADTESHSVRMIDLKTGKLELIAGDGKIPKNAGWIVCMAYLWIRMVRSTSVIPIPTGSV
jgi:DNA-binding beta-propeller fold protein YncE